MALRKLLRETNLPSKALFFFPEENMTGIGPTKIILRKDEAVIGGMVTVNWQGERVEAKIIALSGTYKLGIVVLLSCKFYPSTRYLGLPCYCSFLFVDSDDELSEKDLLWSQQNLKTTAPFDDECHESSRLSNEPPKKRSRSVSRTLYLNKIKPKFN